MIPIKFTVGPKDESRGIRKVTATFEITSELEVDYEDISTERQHVEFHRAVKSVLSERLFQALRNSMVSPANTPEDLEKMPIDSLV